MPTYNPVWPGVTILKSTMPDQMERCAQPSFMSPQRLSFADRRCLRCEEIRTGPEGVEGAKDLSSLVRLASRLGKSTSWGVFIRSGPLREVDTPHSDGVIASWREEPCYGSYGDQTRLETLGRKYLISIIGQYLLVRAGGK